MTADRNDSDARLKGDNPSRPRSSRAVEASRILIESTSIDISQKLNIAEMLLPLDSETAATMIVNIIAELDKMSTSSSPPDYRTINGVLSELFRVVDVLGEQNRDAAIDIYFRVVNTEILSNYRITAVSRMIALESRA